MLRKKNIQGKKVNFPFESENIFNSFYFFAPDEKDTEITTIYSYSFIFNILLRSIFFHFQYDSEISVQTKLFCSEMLFC